MRMDDDNASLLEKYRDLRGTMRHIANDFHGLTDTTASHMQARARECMARTHLTGAEPPDVLEPTDESQPPPGYRWSWETQRTHVTRINDKAPNPSAIPLAYAWDAVRPAIATLRGELEETRRERDGLQRAADLRGDILGKINDAIGVGRHSPWVNLPAGVDFVCKQAIAERAARKEAERQRDEARAKAEKALANEDAARRSLADRDAEVVRLREALERERARWSGIDPMDTSDVCGERRNALHSITQALAAPTQTTDPSETTETPT